MSPDTSNNDNSSSSQLLDFDRFLQELRSDECNQLVTKLKSFLSIIFNTHTNRTVLQQRRLVLKFLETIQNESIQNQVFARIIEERKKIDATSNIQEIDVNDDGSDDVEDEVSVWIREGWEKLVMTRIYDHVFCPFNSEEPKMAVHLEKKIRDFRWIEERHLDLPFTLGSALEVAQAEILKINGFKSPRDKLVITQNTVQLAVDLIKKSAENAGSDHLLPVLILIVIRANPPNIIADIKYIMRFRNQQELDKGQNQYYLTSMMGAVSFIYNLSAKSLSIPREDALKYNLQISPDSTLKPDLLPLPPSPENDPSNMPLQQQHDRSRVASQSINSDLNKVLVNTSGFLNGLFKDVTATVDLFVDGVRGKSSNTNIITIQQPDERERLSPQEVSDSTLVTTNDNTSSKRMTSFGKPVDTNGSTTLSNAMASSSTSNGAVTKLRSFSEGIGRTFSSLLYNDGNSNQQSGASPTTRRKLSIGNQYRDESTQKALENAERDFDANPYYTNQKAPPLPSRPLPPHVSPSSGVYPGHAAYNPNKVYYEDKLGNTVNNLTPIRRQLSHPEFHDPSLIDRTGLTSPERAEIEDYELQLALALSISAQEAVKVNTKEDIVNAVIEPSQDLV